MIDSTELDEKVAIVTGAGQGMGRAVAERLSAAGASIVINDQNGPAASKTAEMIVEGGGKAIIALGNVTSAADVSRMVDTGLNAYGDIHILVNCAGVLRSTAVIDIDEEEWDLVVNVNLKGTYLCGRAVLPSMRQSGWGRIVNFSSTAGKNVSTLGGAHYTASKAGVLGFTRHLAKEEAAYGITVNAVCPGLIDTEMVRSNVGDDRARDYADSFPIQRLGQPGEVAELVAFLTSNRAAYITGASLDINGGDLMI